MQADEFFIAQQINKLSARWKNEFSNLEFRDRCIKKLSGLPSEAIAEIVDVVIDNFRQCPLPRDFEEAVASWRSSYTHKHGHSFGHIEAAEVPPCADCFDTGYIFCKISSVDPETLSFCHCDIGETKENDSAGSVMPRWQKNVFDRAYGFIKLPFPVEAFRPNTDDLVVTELLADARVTWWLDKKRAAQEWWKKRVKNRNSTEEEMK